MPLDFKCKNHGSQLQVMCRVILLVNLQLSRSIGYYFLALHQNTTETWNRSIIVHHEVIGTIG
ncbi:hypothetical protein HanIR_Chr02g0058631 [Helianthus annuus]|nr:hypothetical protein HanIR_Chr02g0058631 [Helianthus annuus]